MQQLLHLGARAAGGYQQAIEFLQKQQGDEVELVTRPNSRAPIKTVYLLKDINEPMRVAIRSEANLMARRGEKTPEPYVVLSAVVEDKLGVKIPSKLLVHLFAQNAFQTAKAKLAKLGTKRARGHAQEEEAEESDGESVDDGEEEVGEEDEEEEEEEEEEYEE